MSADNLPNEILESIFQNLLGVEVLRCRAVCRRWRDVVDRLPDAYWRHVCLEQNEYWKNDYLFVQRKYGLQWRDAYRALNSWEQIHAAPMNIYEVAKNITYIKVLPKGLIAMLVYEKNNNKQAHKYGYTNTIIYYNVDSCQECGREKFDFEFSSRQFDETDSFLVLMKQDATLCIVHKATKIQYCVGTLINSNLFQSIMEELHYTAVTVIGDEIYFQDAKDEVIYMTKLVEENGKAIVKTQPLQAFEKNYDAFSESVVAFSKHMGELFILTDEGNIYSHNNADFEFVSQMDNYNIQIECDDLRYHGFDWKSPIIYNWMTNGHSMYKAFYSHGNVILAAQAHSPVVQICVHNREIEVHQLKDIYCHLKYHTQRKIDLKLFLKGYEGYYKSIKQIDIIENGLSHKVIVLAQEKLIIFEFQPSHHQHMVLRSQASIDNVKAGTSNKKTTAKIKSRKDKTKTTILLKRKSKIKGTISIKKRYATRSSVKL